MRFGTSKSRYFVFLVWGAFLPVVLGAQDRILDSLLQQLDAVPDTSRFPVYYAIHDQLAFNDPGRAEGYLNEALDLALTLERSRDQILCYDKLGGLAMIRSEFQRAISFFQQADYLLDNMDWPREKAVIYGNLAACYKEMGMYDSTLVWNDRFLALAQSLDNPIFMGFGLGLKGQIYHNRGQFDLAIMQHLDALRYYEKTGDSSRLADGYRTIGETMTSAMRLEEAEAYLNDAKRIYQAENDLYYQGQIWRDLGYLYFLRKQYDASKDAYDKSLSLAQDLDDPYGLGQSYINLGDWADSTDNMEMALDYYDRAYTIFQAIKDPFHQGVILQHQADIAFRQKKYPQALRLLDRSQVFLAEVEALSFLQSGYKLYSRVYEQLERPKDALQAYRQYSVIRDSLMTVERDRQLEEARLVYQVEKKDQEIAMLNRDVLLGRLKQRQLWWGLGIFVCLGGGVISFLWLRRRKERQIAKERHLRQQAELAASRLEKEKLERELTTQVLQLCRKNEVLAHIQEEVNRLREKENGTSVADLKRIERTIQQDLRSDEDWEQFLVTFEQVHPRYLDVLQLQYGPLTPTEQKLACLLRMNLSSKEVATLLNITDAGVKKARYRLRKKIEVAGDIPLQTFLSGISLREQSANT